MVSSKYNQILKHMLKAKREYKEVEWAAVIQPDFRAIFKRL